MENKDFDYFNLEGDNEPDETSVEGAAGDELDLSSSESDIFDLNSFAVDDSDDVFGKEKSDNKNKKVKFSSLFSKKNIFRTVVTVFLVFLLTGCIIVGSVAVYAFGYVGGNMENDLISKHDLGNLELSYTTVIYGKNGDGDWVEHKRVHDGENRIWLDYDKELAMAKDPSYTGIPQNLANAFIAIEDRRFLEHDGVDWKRTIAAFVNMVIPIRSGKFGGSTITQQLVKNITKDEEQKASRKVREIMRARYLEGEYTKEVILECYMNTIAMGRGMYGVVVPASYYFGKTVDELTLAECASLACITKSPEYYRPDKNPENNKERRNFVLYEMWDQGLITKEEYDAAVAEELVVVADENAVRNTLEINDYFVDTLIEEAVTILMEQKGYKREAALEDFYNGGYKIYSTVDPKVQAALNKVFTDSQYLIEGKENTTIQGSMTILDYEGNIKGIIGGMGEKTENRGLNRATMSKRQPGSTIKPLAAYAPAIENNLITYSSILEDKKTVYYEGKEYEWFPVNWYDSYKGNMNVEKALRTSVNTIPVALVDLLTPQKSFDFVKGNLMLDGLNPKADINYSPLGMGGTNGGVTTLQSAAAYSVFGNGGLYYEPKTIYSIYDRYGELVYENESSPLVAISEDTATIMNKLLQKVVDTSDGTGRQVRNHIKNVPIYAKTGTSDDANDLWFVGGTPYYVASCWNGFDSMQGIKKKDEKNALKMWGEVMNAIHADLPEKDFSESKYIQTRLYCSETGLLANTGCPTGNYAWYKNSGQKICNTHQGKEITANTVKKIKEYLAAPKPEEPKPEDTTPENTETPENTTDENTETE